jgi:hypothetical protein
MYANTGGKPRGEGGIEGGGKSWAQLLGSSLPSSLNKNILEVVLEKDERGAFMVSDTDCARMMRKLGLDLRPGVHVEGVQLCPNGRGVILITLKDNVKIESFCRYDVLQVTESGIRSSLVKPAGKREVVVTVKGIHPNTRDTVVLDYLSKFGKIVTTKVVHGVFQAGPLQNMKNGDRLYKLEVKPGENVGSYHVIDGQKVSLRYAGQQQTCGRCHETPQKCKGRGIARKCEAEGGVRIEFSDYILSLWKRIGYSPDNDDLTIVDCDQEVEQVEQFTPVKVQPIDEEKYAGVSIRQFPKDTDQGDIIDFLCSNGLPEDKKDETIIKANGIVTIKNLDNATSRQLIEAIHGKLNFGKKLFCNGFVPLSPEKEDSFVAENASSESSQATSSQPGPSASMTGSTPAAPSSQEINPPVLVSDHDFSAQSLASKFPMFDIRGQPSTSTLIRRHSISLLERTPPMGSLAAELLVTTTPRHDLSRTNSMINELRSMAENLSDFGSCLSDSSGDDSLADGVDKEEGFKNMNEKKRNKKKKRKLKLTPGKEQFMKKPNLVTTS